jgi:lysozyme family protein
VRPIDETVCAKIISRVLQREGGIADVHDGKGVTRYGQTDGWLAHYGLQPPETPEQAAANYRVFLRKARLDTLCTVDDTLPDIVIDYAVHSGTSVAIDALQRSLGVPMDAVIGPVTLTKLDQMRRPAVGLLVIAERAELLGLLVSRNTANAEWAKGWNHRLAEQIRLVSREIA